MATAPSSAYTVESTRRDEAVRDVLEDSTDGALEHEAAKAPGLVTTMDGGLQRVGDRINHGIHGRYGVAIFYLGK